MAGNIGPSDRPLRQQEERQDAGSPWDASHLNGVRADISAPERDGAVGSVNIENPIGSGCIGVAGRSLGNGDDIRCRSRRSERAGNVNIGLGASDPHDIVIIGNSSRSKIDVIGANDKAGCRRRYDGIADHRIARAQVTIEQRIAPGIRHGWRTIGVVLRLRRRVEPYRQQDAREHRNQGQNFRSFHNLFLSSKLNRLQSDCAGGGHKTIQPQLRRHRIGLGFGAQRLASDAH